MNESNSISVESCSFTNGMTAYLSLVRVRPTAAGSPQERGPPGWFGANCILVCELRQPISAGLRVTFRAGCCVPAYEDATSLTTPDLGHAPPARHYAGDSP